MPAANNHAPCYVALIDSRTLHTEGMFLPFNGASDPVFEFFSIHALINSFSSVNRRRFILALNTNSCFECTVSGSHCDYTVELYSTRRFSAEWSHMLILRRPCSTGSRKQIFPESSVTDIPIAEVLSAVQRYHCLAANSLLADAPPVIRQYLDEAVRLCGRLVNLIYESLL